MLSIRAGRPGQAIDLLEACLLDGPKDDRAELDRFLNEAKAHIARWN